MIAVLAEPTILMPVLLFLGTMPSGAEFRWNKAGPDADRVRRGLAACTKFICFLLVVALMPLLILRKPLATALASLASFLLFWLAARQGLSNIPAFVRQSMEISSGYASAMVSGRPLIELLLALLLCGLPLLQLTRQIMPPVDLEKLGCLGWLGICEFLIFRHGLIRIDSGHWYMAFLAVGVPIAVLLIPLPSWQTQGLAIMVEGSLHHPLLSSLACSTLVCGGRSRKEPRFSWSRFDSIPCTPAELFSFRVQERAVSVDAGGSMDVFPYELSYAIEQGLPLHNRPVIQSYSAYTKSLCEKNAAFLEGQDAPQTIYFQFRPH